MPGTGNFATSTEIEKVIKAFSQIKRASVRHEVVRTIEAIAKAEATTPARATFAGTV